MAKNKNITEEDIDKMLGKECKTAEVLGLCMQIDMCYYLIEEATKRLNLPTTPIERMVDEATGSGASMVKQAREDVILMLKTIIRCKKKLGGDYSGGERFLKQLQQL